MKLLLVAFLAGLSVPPAHASVNDIFAELFGRPERGGVKITYGMQQYEATGIRNSGQKLKLRQHSADASIPLNSLIDRKWKLLLQGNADEIGSAASFPNRRPMPHNLWSAGAGLSYLRLTDDNRTIGGSFLVGSASDRPYGAFRDVTLQGNFVYKIPQENEAAWLFFVNFANNRGFLNYLPLPGFAYFFRAHERVRLALGVPFFSLFYTPFDKAVLSVSYFPLYNAQAKFSYFLFGPAHLFLQAKYESRNYLLSDRTDRRERFFYEEALATGGFSMPLERFALLEGALGYSFDRKYFLGRKSSDRKNGQLLRVDPAPFASVKLTATF